MSRRTRTSSLISPAPRSSPTTHVRSPADSPARSSRPSNGAPVATPRSPTPAASTGTSCSALRSRRLPMLPEGRRTRVATEAVVVLLVATAVVCALFWRMVIHLDSILVEPSSDVPGTIGWLYSLQHEGGYHLFGTTHHTLT